MGVRVCRLCVPPSKFGIAEVSFRLFSGRIGLLDRRVRRMGRGTAMVAALASPRLRAPGSWPRSPQEEALHLASSWSHPPHRPLTTARPSLLCENCVLRQSAPHSVARASRISLRREVLKAVLNWSVPARCCPPPVVPAVQMHCAVERLRQCLPSGLHVLPFCAGLAFLVLMIVPD